MASPAQSSMVPTVHILFLQVAERGGQEGWRVDSVQHGASPLLGKRLCCPRGETGGCSPFVLDAMACLSGQASAFPAIHWQHSCPGATSSFVNLLLGPSGMC